MIQLICRWMCPESLHVYRRMGTREHERHITVASGMNVDVMQATNYPRISNDEGYGNIVAGLQGPRGRDAQRDYEAAMATIRQAPQRAAPTTPRPPPRPRATPAPTAARAAAPAPPPTPVAPNQPPSTAAITGRPARGTRVFVQRHLWPTYVTHATSTPAKAGLPPSSLRRPTHASSASTSRVHQTALPLSRNASPRKRCCCFSDRRS